MKQKEDVLPVKLKFEAPSWNQIYNMLLGLADMIRKDCFKPDIIVGLSRGGWPPARVLSDLLSSPNLANVRAEFYLGVGETKSEPTLTQPISVAVEGKSVLIVDEVADTGKTLKLVKEHIIEQGAAEVRTATVYCKPWSNIKPDYHSKETSDWIIFPWEVKETIRKIITECKENGKPVAEEAEKLREAGIPDQLIKRFLKEILEEERC
jgi:hypoxanthine phosphoribosyltransferase